MRVIDSFRYFFFYFCCLRCTSCDLTLACMNCPCGRGIPLNQWHNDKISSIQKTCAVCTRGFIFDGMWGMEGQVRSCSEMQTWLCACLRAQGSKVWIRVIVQRLGAPLVPHLAPQIELKEAGGTPCHAQRQGPQGLSRSRCVADLHSDDQILRLVLSLSRLHIRWGNFCVMYCAGDNSRCFFAENWTSLSASGSGNTVET